MVGSGFDEPDCGDSTGNSDAKKPDVSPAVSVDEPTEADCPEIILERTAQHPPRITSLCRLAKGESLTLHNSTGSIEALVLSCKPTRDHVPLMLARQPEIDVHESRQAVKACFSAKKERGDSHHPV